MLDNSGYLLDLVCEGAQILHRSREAQINHPIAVVSREGQGRAVLALWESAARQTSGRCADAQARLHATRDTRRERGRSRRRIGQRHPRH